MYTDTHTQTDTQTHTHTDRHTDRPTDGHENSIVAVDKPSMFQTSDIELLAQKLKLNIPLTKSTKRDNIYKLCLFTLEEHKGLILRSLYVPNIAPMLKNNDLSYTSQNHSSVTILKPLVIDVR